MSELAPERRAFARAHFVYTYDYEVVDNGELCAHLMLHNPIFVICARGSFVKCFIITVIISTKQRGFWKTLEIMHDKEKNYCYGKKT